MQGQKIVQEKDQREALNSIQQRRNIPHETARWLLAKKEL
jgi:hypothetical protein